MTVMLLEMLEMSIDPSTPLSTTIILSAISLYDTSVDAFGQHADASMDSSSIEIDKYHAAGEPEPCIEIDDCYLHPAGNVFPSVDAVYQHAQDVSDLVVDMRQPAENNDDCYPAGDVLTCVDALCQHAEVRDELSPKHPTHPAGDVFTSVDAFFPRLHYELSYIEHLYHDVERPRV